MFQRITNELSLDWEKNENMNKKIVSIFNAIKHNGVIYRIKLGLMRSKWRKNNRHNETTAVNRFPMEKISVGNHTYGSIKYQSWGAENEALIIGSFVSIASDVIFLGGGNHKLDIFTTFPFEVKFQNKVSEAISNGPIIVQDDVWIGQGAFILSGVKLGQGAVIAAKSVVVKDVPPYAIVGGNPAKIIRYRFTENQIKKLIELDYSKIPDKFFSSDNKLLDGNIDAFLNSSEFKKMSTKKEL